MRSTWAPMENPWGTLKKNNTFPIKHGNQLRAPFHSMSTGHYDILWWLWWAFVTCSYWNLSYQHLSPSPTPPKNGSSTVILHDTSSIQFSSFRRFQAHSHSISPGSILNLRHLHGLFHVANFHFGNFLHDFDVFHLWHLHDIVMDRLQDHRHLFGHQPDRQIATVGSKPWGFNIHHWNTRTGVFWSVI